MYVCVCTRLCEIVSVFVFLFFVSFVFCTIVPCDLVSPLFYAELKYTVFDGALWILREPLLHELCEGYEDSASTFHWLKIHDFLLLLFESIVFDRLTVFAIVPAKNFVSCRANTLSVQCAIDFHWSTTAIATPANQTREKKGVFSSSLTHSKSYFFGEFL